MKKILSTLTISLVVLFTNTTQAQEVSLLNHGAWLSHKPGVFAAFYNAWIDIKILDVAANKKVGVVWTTNTWSSSDTSLANLEMPMNDGFEQWGLDITPAYVNYSQCSYCAPRDIVLEYAIFFQDLDSGYTYWDNNDGENYSLVLNPRPY